MKGPSLFRLFLLIILTAVFSFVHRTALCEDSDVLKKLQEENKTLQEQLNTQKETIEILSKKIEALENKDVTLSKEIKDIKVESQKPVSEESPKILSKITEPPKLNIRGFADMGFTAKLTENGDTNTFGLGDFSLFLTSQITERVGFLSEMSFHAEETNEFMTDLERVTLTYWVSNSLSLKLGKMHTPLGYWNQTFHHGNWLQTTIGRPEVYLFEHDNGILPTHSVGAEVFGVSELDAFDLGYNFSVSNGRAKTSDESQLIQDSNDSKAINMLFSVQPHSLEGLTIGTVIYYDTIPSDLSNPERTGRIRELILGGYTTYIHDRIELLGEAFNVSHDDKTSGRTFDTLGFYLQGAYKIDKFKPYYRFDFIDFENGDPYYASIDTDIIKNTLGMRWDIFSWNALKFEYSFSDKKNSDNEHAFRINTSFIF